MAFSFAAFRIPSSAFAILTHFGVHLFVFIFFGILCAFYTCIPESLFGFGNFSAIISSNTFLIPISPSLPLGTPIMQMLACLIYPRDLLNRVHVLKFVFFFYCYFDWVISITLLLMHFSVLPHLFLILMCFFK